MGIQSVRRREYDPEKHGNVFDWLVEESERIRYWSKRGIETQAPKPAPILRSLRSKDSRHSAHVFQPQEPGLQAPRENTFEISKARKL
jgi:hypothetical protein